MLDDHLSRIRSASEALADSIQVYSSTLSAFGREVEAHYNAGIFKDRYMLQNLVSTIDNLLETISSHMSRLENPHSSLRKTKNYLNPVNSLHPELLDRIFSMSIYDNSVCGYWRHVTFGIGTLWSFIPVHLTGRSTQRRLDVAHVWPERARTAPLDVSIDIAEIGDTLPFGATLNNVLGFLLSSKQIHTLCLSLARTTYLNALLGSCFSDGVPGTLAKLRIEVYNKIDETSTVQDWLPRCQELRVLQLSIDTLRDDHFSVLPKLVELELSALILTSLTTERLANILHACPSLQRLMLEDISLDSATHTSRTPALLSHLKTLILQHVDAVLILPLVLSKSTPLSLTIIDHSLDLSNDDLVDQIRIFSHRTTITALHLDVADLGHDFRRFPRLFPHLLTLSLQDFDLDDLMINILQGASESVMEVDATPSVFPTLQAIRLAECRIENEEALRALIRICPLKQLKLDHCTFGRLGSILKAKTLHDYLLSSVSDLIILE
ncbi:hypothetical protein BDV93DRAFT_544097 [Ceratobasidium sp. AG-I]|nr:hypothetical protein BDV93DRAFT_544097 [Ceratobasidium sp. AG-I]